MKMEIGKCKEMLDAHHIYILYNGFIWSKKLEELSVLMQAQLEQSNMPAHASQSVFSIFVEKMNNIISYSADKEVITVGGENVEASKGIFIFGEENNTFFIQTGNTIKNSNVEFLKKRIDHVNTLEKSELRKYQKAMLLSRNENPESRGAGVGLIEIARRATSKIEYDIIQVDENKSFITMYTLV